MEKKMNLREKLERIHELNRKIEMEAKSWYEERNQLEAECAVEMINRKNGSGKSEIYGLLTTSIRMKFKDGAVFELKPEYMSKEGDFKNVVWKSAGPSIFSIKKVEE